MLLSKSEELVQHCCYIVIMPSRIVILLVRHHIGCRRSHGNDPNSFLRCLQWTWPNPWSVESRRVKQL